MVLQTRPISVEEICNKLRPVFGEKIDRIYLQYTLADGREEREEIAHLLNSLYQKNLSQLLDKGVLLEPPQKEDMSGDYNLGVVSYANKSLFDFTLREKDWQRHMCVTGMSGSGKTNFAFRIIQELERHNKKFLVFDWKKSFRPLLAENPRLMNITVGDQKVSNVFKVNINCPPEGVSPKEWVVVLADLLTESFMASFGVHKIILETLDDSFKEWGIYNGSTNYPTWNHIKHKLEEKLETIQGREAGWLESALRIATVLTFGEFGKTLNYKGKNSITIDDILNGQVVMELNSLGTVEKKFFCEFLLNYIYKLKKARQNDSEQKFDHVIIVDEAHNIFLRKPTNFSNESVTDMIYREMREYGTSLICLDQHISKISDTVKGNSACHIAFAQQLPQDIEDVASLMQLREKKHFFSGLKVGTAIVKLSERYTNPFLIQVPLAEKRKAVVSNEDVKGRMQGMILNAEFEKGEDPLFNEAIMNKEISEPEVNTCFYRKGNQRFSGVHDKIKGNASNIVGDTSHITGDVSNVRGNVSNLVGNISKISGDVTFITGEITGLFGDVTTLRGDITNLTGDVQELMKQYETIQNQEGRANSTAIGEENVTKPQKLEVMDVPEYDSSLKEVTAEEKKNTNETNLLEKHADLTEAQNLIYEYVNEHLDAGMPLAEIETILEQSKSQGKYTSQDIMKVVNKMFESELNKKVKKPHVDTVLNTSLSNDNISEDERVFIEFLRENPKHTLSTVEVYKAVGLSARKGTNAKKALEEKNLIKIEEIKYDKGWKKIIRLA